MRRRLTPPESTRSCTDVLGKKKVLFVYDLVANDSDFDTLRFTLDAVRPPRSSALFEKLYGLPRFLQFEKSARRAPESVDMWAGIYG